MNTLPIELENIIYSYKHQLELIDCLKEIPNNITYMFNQINSATLKAGVDTYISPRTKYLQNKKKFKFKKSNKKANMNNNNFININGYGGKYKINNQGIIISYHRKNPYTMNVDRYGKLHLSFNRIRTHHKIRDLITQHFS